MLYCIHYAILHTLCYTGFAKDAFYKEDKSLCILSVVFSKPNIWYKFFPFLSFCTIFPIKFTLNFIRKTRELQVLYSITTNLILLGPICIKNKRSIRAYNMISH